MTGEDLLLRGEKILHLQPQELQKKLIMLLVSEQVRVQDLLMEWVRSQGLCPERKTNRIGLESSHHKTWRINRDIEEWWSMPVSLHTNSQHHSIRDYLWLHWAVSCRVFWHQPARQCTKPGWPAVHLKDNHPYQASPFWLILLVFGRQTFRMWPALCATPHGHNLSAPSRTGQNTPEQEKLSLFRY